VLLKILLTLDMNLIVLQGIEYLIEQGVLEHDPQSVAQYLRNGEGLHKTAIGDYLGER
jgi:Sec7 domain